MIFRNVANVLLAFGRQPKNERWRPIQGANYLIEERFERVITFSRHKICSSLRQRQEYRSFGERTRLRLRYSRRRPRNNGEQENYADYASCNLNRPALDCRSIKQAADDHAIAPFLLLSVLPNCLYHSTFILRPISSSIVVIDSLHKGGRLDRRR